MAAGLVAGSAVMSQASPSSAFYEEADPTDTSAITIVLPTGGAMCTLVIKPRSNPKHPVMGAIANETAYATVTRRNCNSGRLALTVGLTDQAPGDRRFKSDSASAASGPVSAFVQMQVPYSAQRPVGVMRASFQIEAYGVVSCIEDVYEIDFVGRSIPLGSVPCSGA